MDSATEAACRRWTEAREELSRANARVAAAANLYLAGKESRESITNADVAVSSAEFDGRRQVVAHIRAFDAHGMADVVAVLSLSPEEAKRIGKALIAGARADGEVSL